MKLKTLFSVTVLIAAASAQNALAHEGHDKTPGSVAAPHGGVVQGDGELLLELVTEGGGIKLYPLSDEGVAVSSKAVTLSGTVTFPKKPKPEILKIATDGDHFSAKVDSKGAYRYTLDLTAGYEGKKEKIKFQVEPQN